MLRAVKPTAIALMLAVLAGAMLDQKTSGVNLDLSPLVAELGEVARGLVVAGVASDSPARDAIKLHDVLVELDGQLLINPEQLAVLVHNHRAGEEERQRAYQVHSRQRQVRHRTLPGEDEG